MKNLGVIIESKPTDFYAGKLPYEIINPSGVWIPPSEEKQSSNYADSMACVTFSALNCIETQYEFFTGQDINFSDRFIANISGTTPQGNSIQNVLDAIRHYGLVLEKDYPTPKNFTWNDYYTSIPPEVFDKAILKPVNGISPISYEFGSTDYTKDLKQAPLQMVVLKDNPYHAVEMINLTEEFDSYAPFIKPQQSIHLICKIILKGIPMIEFVHITETTEYGLLVSTPVGKQYVPASTEEDLKARGGTKIPLLPDGKIDYSKAREITL